jgi:two-component system, OmpR family, sensor kinase
MGRLYWKFFAFFFLAQVTTVLMVTVAIGIIKSSERTFSPNTEISRPNTAPQQGKLKKHMLEKRMLGRHMKNFFPIPPLVVGGIVSFIFAAILANYFSKPIRQLRQAFERAASGDLQVRVGDSMQGRQDELADLGDAFDVMVSRISQVLQSQTTLLHQVSHELRSPLSRLQMAIGLLKKQPDTLNSALERLERESVRMDSLVGELLTLSRLESGVMTLQKEPIDLNELLADLIEDAQFEGEAKHLSIVLHDETTQALMIEGQQDLLHRAIENVLRNAIKYSTQSGQINIKLEFEHAKNVATVMVRDNGTGVREADLARIFTPFFRAENDSNQGYGLGLAIAKQIIEAHGGKIFAQQATNGGLELIMRLPVVLQAIS